ncbi:ATP-binding protein [Staphylococcus equorum]|uniref:ATP-binding protein n=1 Tax=Staphylococcus equorum TaxID=246432 RepID=UPI0022B0568B|nr:ATP-binding protein [Staphylococcus equorum]MCZ4237831.1 ATP-binding protein [Staphylococcus equorum]
MKLHSVKIENFRGYKHEIFTFDELTALIGRNDVGKSTILEALDIFFNSENKTGYVKPEVSDLNIYSEDLSFSITCIFDVENETKIKIDSTNYTDLKDEYLLNEDNRLEIIKSWDCSKMSLTAKSLSVQIRSFVPYLHDKILITMKINDLKKELNAIKEFISNYENINKSKKADIRKTLYDYYSEDIEKHTVNIPIKEIESDNSDLWKTISKNLPMFFLFQSDRSNSDSDTEIQSPLKIATKKVLKNKEEEIKKLEQEIVEEVSKISDQTVEKLNELDSSIAKNLTTNYTSKPWDTLYSFDISDDRGVPINKRGSGIRRLMLLSYFRVEAEKTILNSNTPNIIYGIEEPETSQHPNFQILLLESFKELVKTDNNQIIFTTHTPEMAKLLSPSETIYIEKDHSNFPRTIIKDNEKVHKISESLGILPDFYNSFVICVEGENDVNFLKIINQIPELNSIIDLTNIPIIPMSGGKLEQWVERDYLQNSNVKEFHLYDSDVQSYVDKITKMNSSDDDRRKGINTKLPEMENYVPSSIINNYFNISISDETAKSKELLNHLLNTDKINISNHKEKSIAIKSIINGSLSKNITFEELKYHDVDKEIVSWFTEMKNWKNSI